MAQNKCFNDSRDFEPYYYFLPLPHISGHIFSSFQTVPAVSAFSAGMEGRKRSVMIYKSCPKCKALIPYGTTYCPACTQKVQEERQKRKAERDKAYNARRDPKYKQFYNSKPWKLLSEKRLSEEKHCRFCGKPASEVDHIVDIHTPEGWKRRLEWDNTRSLCHKCHDKRHNRFQKRRKSAP